MVIYKTLNLINGKIYIGKDFKNNPEYLGSGLLLEKAIKKYKRENFKKEILDICTSRKELNNKEKYWIKKLNATNPKIGYNIALGGEGGDTISVNPNKTKIFKNIWKKRKANPNFKNRCHEIAIKCVETKRNFGKIVSPFKGKKHSKKSIQKLRNASTKNINDYPINIINEIKDMYLSQISVTNIKSRLHIGNKIIERVIKKYGLSRKRKPVHNKKITIDEFKIMVDSNKNKTDIMNYFNISDRTYNRYFYKLGYSKKK